MVVKGPGIGLTWDRARDPEKHLAFRGVQDVVGDPWKSRGTRFIISSSKMIYNIII